MNQGSEGEDVAWFAPMGHQVTNGDTKASQGWEERSRARGLTLFTPNPRVPFPANGTISCHSEPQDPETRVSRADPEPALEKKHLYLIHKTFQFY